MIDLAPWVLQSRGEVALPKRIGSACFSCVRRVSVTIRAGVNCRKNAIVAVAASVGTAMWRSRGRRNELVSLVATVFSMPAATRAREAFPVQGRVMQLTKKATQLAKFRQEFAAIGSRMKPFESISDSEAADKLQTMAQQAQRLAFSGLRGGIRMTADEISPRLDSTDATRLNELTKLLDIQLDEFEKAVDDGAFSAVTVDGFLYPAGQAEQVFEKIQRTNNEVLAIAEAVADGRPVALARVVEQPDLPEKPRVSQALPIVENREGMQSGCLGIGGRLVPC